MSNDRVAVNPTLLETRSLLTKTIRNENGRLAKVAAVYPTRGVYTTVTLSGTPVEILAALKRIIEGLGQRQALIAGQLPSSLRPDGWPWVLCRDGEAEDGLSLPRTKATFKWMAGTALGFLDFDVPEALRPYLRNAKVLCEFLLRAWPGFRRSALLIRPSVSAGAKIAGQPTPLPTGFHLFLVVSNGERLGDLADRLFDRFALMGAAVVESSSRGYKLPKALVDRLATKGAERLIFEADPFLDGPGLERVRRDAELFDGSILDVGKPIAALTLSDSEQLELGRIWLDAETKAAPELAAAKASWLENNTSRIAEKRKIPRAEARRIAEREATQFEAGELRDDFEITLDDGSVVTVYDILTDPGRYKGARGCSLDEHTPRRGVVFIQPYDSKPDPKTGKPEGPWLHTFEHGGRYFRLRSLRADVENNRSFAEKFFVKARD